MSQPFPRSGRAAAVCLLLSALLAGCSGGVPLADADRPAIVPEGQLLAGEAVTRQAGPMPEGTCRAEEVLPAVIETVTEQQEVLPARIGPDGAVQEPARFETSTRQRIVADRRAVWFAVPCPEVMGPDGIGTLQRALKVRGLYRGAVTGIYDAATMTAVRQYQAPQGLDSGTLSLAAARQLGLVALDRDSLG